MISGLAVVDKPAGWTSHDVVARCRRVFGQKQVGHSGTLDPDATGVLLVGLGRVTRLLRYLTELPKVYVGEVVLGVETSTLDAAGEVTATFDMAVSDTDVQQVLPRFIGSILQIPPMVSAVKIGGRRLHELARAGIEVDRPARPVTVYRLEVGPIGEGILPIEVACSSGTYIRTLAADLGHALGGGAHLRNLRRIAIGSFGVAEAIALDKLGPNDALSPSAALRDYPSFTVDDDAAAAVAHGRVLPAGLGSPTGPVAVLDRIGQLLAVYEPGDAGCLKAAVVLTG